MPRLRRKSRGDPDGARRKKRCPFLAAKMTEVDYKDVDTLGKFVTERGKILPRRITGVSVRMHRRLVMAIKRARQIALLPFVAQV